MRLSQAAVASASTPASKRRAFVPRARGRARRLRRLPTPATSLSKTHWATSAGEAWRSAKS
eukprot:3589972-Lingulodinium_polyedra.AAC.1